MANSLKERIAQQDPRYVLLSNEEKRRQLTQEIAVFIGAAAFMQPDVLIYLDKSSRPISWVVNRVWKSTFPAIKKPETKFMNFGREKSIVNDLVGETGKPRLSLSLRGKEELKTSAELFRQEYGNRSAGTYLDGKSLWLVDEVSQTGSSLTAAKIIITEALSDKLPEPIFTHTVLSSEPIWYRDNWMIGVDDNTYNMDTLLSVAAINNNGAQLRGELRAVADDIIAQY